ncbi:hypothetical protein ACJX0J_030403 [Zea mays]
MKQKCVIPICLINVSYKIFTKFMTKVKLDGQFEASSFYFRSSINELFFWQGDEDKKKYRLAKWSIIMIFYGGFQVRFWEDNWLCGTPISWMRQLFGPNLIALNDLLSHIDGLILLNARNPSSFVSKNVEIYDGELWNLT